MPPPPGGFYRRPLPAPGIAFASAEGVALFKSALATGGASAYFALSENFRTQDEPAYCGLGTLVTALNTLAIDPGLSWKGVWRWYSEDALSCCKPLEEVAAEGINLDQWKCLAECNMATVDMHRATASNEDEFRKEVIRCCSAPNSGAGVLCVSYSRITFNQTGDGHFSPIGAYDTAKDMVLILDVARFKHPPHWVPLGEMYKSMLRLDPSTQQSRGWATLTRNSTVGGSLFVLSQTFDSWKHVEEYFKAPADLAAFEGTAEAFLYETIFRLPGNIAACVSTHADQYADGTALTPKVVQEACSAIADLPSAEGSLACGRDCSRILTELEATPLYLCLARETTKSQPLPMSLPNAVVLLLCVSRSTELPEPLRNLIGETVQVLPEEFPELQGEVDGLAELLRLATSADGPWRDGPCGAGVEGGACCGKPAASL